MLCNHFDVEHRNLENYSSKFKFKRIKIYGMIQVILSLDAECERLKIRVVTFPLNFSTKKQTFRT